MSIKQLFRRILGLDDDVIERKKELASLDDRLNQILSISQANQTRQYQANQKDMKLSSRTPSFEDMEMEYRRSFRKNFMDENKNTVTNVESMIFMYDHLLYYNRPFISHYELNRRMMSLRILRDEIISKLFDGVVDTDFYLTYNDSHLFDWTIDQIALVDRNRLLEFSDVNENANYINIDLSDAGVFITTSAGVEIEIASDKQITLVRVLYSIYMDQMFLYHIAKS